MIQDATIRRIVEVMEAARTDRIALVRRAASYREAGLFVLMGSPQAVRDLGPICIQAAGKVTDEVSKSSNIGEIQPDDKLEDWFQMMERTKLYFAWGKQDEPYRMFSFFVGGEVCEWLAPMLTEQNCPCSLK